MFNYGNITCFITSPIKLLCIGRKLSLSPDANNLILRALKAAQLYGFINGEVIRNAPSPDLCLQPPPAVQSRASPRSTVHATCCIMHVVFCTFIDAWESVSTSKKRYNHCSDCPLCYRGAFDCYYRHLSVDIATVLWR